MSEIQDKSLILAAEYGDLDTVREMLALGANPNAMGPQSAALHCAAFEGHLEIVKYLLDNKADSNLVDTRGFYALQLAASKGRVEVALALIAAGANLEARTKHGGTALHVATASNFPDVVQLLLDAGADLEARDAGGNTPLATACGLGRKQIFHQLQKAGANMRTLSDAKETLLIKVARGIRVLRVKSWFSQGEIEGEPVSYQLKMGVMRFTKGGATMVLDRETERFVASQSWGPTAHLVYMDAFDLVQELLALGYKPSATDADGNTAFSLICHAGIGLLIESMCKALLRARKDAAIVHADGFQPIHLVAGSERIDGLETFLEYAFDVDANARDAYGWTPLHWLADMGGDVKMAELLIAAGADKLARSTRARGANMPEGITPAEVATHWGDAEMAEALSVI
jgi:ankyrin repeat protein